MNETKYNNILEAISKSQIINKKIIKVMGYTFCPFNFLVMVGLMFVASPFMDIIENISSTVKNQPLLYITINFIYIIICFMLTTIHMNDTGYRFLMRKYKLYPLLKEVENFLLNSEIQFYFKGDLKLLLSNQFDENKLIVLTSLKREIEKKNLKKIREIVLKHPAILKEIVFNMQKIEENKNTERSMEIGRYKNLL